MSRIMWIIGAGASKHVGMPLLREFRSFFGEIWNRFPENRDDPELSAVLPNAMAIMDSHSGNDIEQLLLPSSHLTDEDRNVLKRAIRHTFERRQLGRFARLSGSHTPGIVHKFEAYARLVLCMRSGDAVISFNYDNAFEYIMSCVVGNFDLLNLSELSSNQFTALRRQGLHRWVPGDCQALLREVQLRYRPATTFSGASPTFGEGSTIIDLVKVHGSINWFSGDRDQIQVGRPPTTTKVPLLAYPEPNKPEASRPPLSLVMLEAVSRIDNFDRIVIIGYSFPNSDSTGHPFAQRLIGRLSTKQVLAIDPFPGTSLRAAVERSRNKLVVEESFEKSFSSSKFDGKNLSQFIESMRSVA